MGFLRNISKVPVTIILDTAPEIGGIREFYLACGYDADYLEGITAVDTVDGDVSGSVTVDKGDLDTDTVGEYEIVYQVTDSYGLSEEESTTVYVMEPLDLQREINTHKISRLDQTIVGAINLYDSGYYEEDNVDFIIEEMTSTRVRIRFDRSDGYWSFGSGYIIKMNEDEIILGTNHHVISGRDKWDVYFHDGTKAEGTVIGSNKAKDIAFVRVSSADVPKGTFDTLKTVHINKGYWDSLENNAGIALCIRCIDNSGGVWRDRTGKMNQKMLVPGTMPELPETDNETWTSLAQFHGCSGSAILDGHGNLIAMSVSIASYYGKTYQMAVNLEEILKAYEEIVGECAYYE